MASSLLRGGYAADSRDPTFSAGGLRSHPTSPAGGSAVSFAGSAYGPRPSSPRRPAFECDYDVNPTELYLSVQRKDWDGAVERAAACPHEASTWVSRKEGDGKLRWRFLPLHAAIIFRAPERTISALLFAFAQGAACKDDQGMLPLHLAFRNGCDEAAVELLLMAYPQSVDVQDRKGRTPMVLAQQSTHANREAYIRALERGPAYYAVAGAAKEGMVPALPSPGAALPPTTAAVTQALASATPALPVLEAGAYAPPAAGSNDRVAALEAELAKTQETSQVLVDHVNSLEAQLASRSDTERFLATKIANLDAQLKESTAKLAEAGELADAKDEELAKKDEESDERAKGLEEEVETLKVALADKKEAELKSYKLTNKERFDLEERVETSERECAAAQANAAVLEAQLKKKIETEQSLASQVSMLASQLASSASSSSEAASAHQKKCEHLAAENKRLQAHVEELEGKLGTVATALDAMAAEQERIVEAATKHESTMAACVQANRAIVGDTARQETLLEDAAKEREQIVSILMRQAEDAERTMSDREKVLEAVQRQENDIGAAADERDAVVASVNKQREYMDFMLNGELRFLKQTESEEEKPLVKEQKMGEMEAKKAAYEAGEEEEGEGAPASPVEDEEEEASEEDEEEEDAALEEAAEAVKAAVLAAEEGHIGEVDEEDKPAEEGYDTPGEEEAADEEEE
ncbi:hypothetical protein ACHAXT_006434 [Thalassiosira profunda]